MSTSSHFVKFWGACEESVGIWEDRCTRLCWSGKGHDLSQQEKQVPKNMPFKHWVVLRTQWCSCHFCLIWLVGVPHLTEIFKRRACMKVLDQCGRPVLVANSPFATARQIFAHAALHSADPSGSADLTHPPEGQELLHQWACLKSMSTCPYIQQEGVARTEKNCTSYSPRSLIMSFESECLLRAS